MAIKWIQIHVRDAQSGAPTSEDALRSVLAENQFVMRITYSLLQPLRPQHANPEFAALGSPPAAAGLEEANVVNGYNICGNLPMSMLRKLRRGVQLELDDVRSCCLFGLLLVSVRRSRSATCGPHSACGFTSCTPRKLRLSAAGAGQQHGGQCP